MIVDNLEDIDSASILDPQSIFELSDQSSDLANSTKKSDAPNLSKVKTQVRPLLDAMYEKQLSLSQVENTLHRAIDNDPKLRRQLKRALEAGGQEALRTVFAHPLIRIPSVAVKAWLEEEGSS